MTIKKAKILRDKIVALIETSGKKLLPSAKMQILMLIMEK